MIKTENSLRSIDWTHRQINYTDWVAWPWSPEFTRSNVMRSSNLCPLRIWAGPGLVLHRSRGRPGRPTILPEAIHASAFFSGGGSSKFGLNKTCLVCFEVARNINDKHNRNSTERIVLPTANIFSCYAGNWSFSALAYMLYILAQNLFAAGRKARGTLPASITKFKPAASHLWGLCPKTWCNLRQLNMFHYNSAAAHHINISFFFRPHSSSSAVVASSMGEISHRSGNSSCVIKQFKRDSWYSSGPERCLEMMFMAPKIREQFQHGVLLQSQSTVLTAVWVPASFLLPHAVFLSLYHPFLPSFHSISIHSLIAVVIELSNWGGCWINCELDIEVPLPTASQVVFPRLPRDWPLTSIVECHEPRAFNRNHFFNSFFAVTKTQKWYKNGIRWFPKWLLPKHPGHKKSRHFMAFSQLFTGWPCWHHRFSARVMVRINRIKMNELAIVMAVSYCSIIFNMVYWWYWWMLTNSYSKPGPQPGWNDIPTLHYYKNHSTPCSRTSEVPIMSWRSKRGICWITV